MRANTGLIEILRTIAIRWRLVVSLTTVLTGLTIAAVYLLPPKYSAKAMIEVSPFRPELNRNDPFAAAVNDTMSTNTESARIASEEMAWAVFQRLDAGPEDSSDPSLLQRMLALLPCGAGGDDPPGYAFWCRDRLADLRIDAAEDEIGARRDEFAAFQKRFSASSVRGTRLIEITFTAATSAEAAQGANAFADEYLRRKVEEKTKLRGKAMEWLDARLAELSGNVADGEQAIAAYRADTSLIEMGKEVDGARRTPTVEELAALLTQLSAAKAARADAQTRLAALADLRGNPDSVAFASEIEDSAIVRDLLLQEAAAQHRLAELASTYGEKHPAMHAARAEAGELRAKVDREIERVLASAEQHYRNAEAVVERLLQEAATLQARVATEDQQRVALRDLERRTSAEADVYSNYLRLAQEVETSQSWNDPGAAIISPAMPPSRPVFPDKRLMLPLGLIASLSFSVLLAVGLELRRQFQVFVDPRNMVDETGLSAIGAVPRVRRLRSRDEARDFALAIEDVAFRLCGVPARRDDGASSVAVTSSIPGEGKSVLAVSLGRALAGSSDARVLLIDADLRQPRIYRLMGESLARFGAEFVDGFPKPDYA